MITRIMVPLDGTRFAEAAIPYALYLAKRDGAALQLATVWQPMNALIGAGEWIPQMEEWEETKRDDTRRYMSEVARRIGEATHRSVSIRYLMGRPDEEIAKLAAESETDLIVMATHGSGPISRVWLGSVADRLVRRGTVPVLLIRPEDEMPEVSFEPGEPFRKILIPLDGSERAELALDKSLLMGAGPRTTQLTLLKVVGLPAAFVATREGTSLPDAEAMLEAQQEVADDYLTGMAATLKTWGCKVDTAVVADPITWKAIMDFAVGGKYDLIAMATRGRGGVARAVLGSVADKVMRCSPVPTMLFHPEPAEHKESFQEKLSAEVLVEWPWKPETLTHR